MYLRMFNTLRQLGFKKTAVKVALFAYEHAPDKGKLFDAVISYLYIGDMGFERCEVCWQPILSDTEPSHESCRKYIQQQLENDERSMQEYEAEWQAYHEAERQRAVEQRHYDDLMESFCTEPECYAFVTDSWYHTCTKHVPEEECRSCDHPLSQCTCADDIDDDPRWDDDDDICDGICGQPTYACTCAETESLRAFRSDPATAGSYWTA